MQVTHLSGGAESGLRWHPSGNSIACISDGGIAATCVQPGRTFGKTVFLTPRNDGAPRMELVWSPDGTQLAYGRETPTNGDDGKPYTTYAGKNPTQIFVCPFPDENGDGIADGV